LAKVYRELFQKYKDAPGFSKNAKFFLIDFNGEYVDEQDDVIIEKKYKTIYKLSTRTANGDKFPLTGAALNSPEFWAVFLEATKKMQTPFLRRALENAYIAEKIKTEGELKEHIASMIFNVTTRDDRTIEKGIVTAFLTDLRDALNDNQSIGALVEDYRKNLQFHGKNGQFYYQNGAKQIFSTAGEEFRNVAVESKVNPLNIPVGELTTIDEIRLKIVIQYYDDLFRGFASREHIGPLITRMDRRLEDLKKVIELDDEAVQKNITIVSLRDVSMHLRKILPLLLCKELYDEKKAQANEQTYLNLIIDEAHNILSEESQRESEQWKDYRLETFEEIIKEGRKFGVFLTLASQRPADISPTIISQLHNYFLHRLINDQDIKAVERTISYLDKVSFEYLPILPTGTCIFAGLLANVPVVIDIEKMELQFEPKNKTRTLADKWH
jgi:hypothetical protein